MNKIIIFLFFTFVLFSCEKENNGNSNETPDTSVKDPKKLEAGVFVSVEELKKFVPIEAYEKYKHIIYKNESGAEMKWNIDFNDSLKVDRELNKIKYQSGQFESVLYEPNTRFILLISASASFVDSTQIYKLISYGTLQDTKKYFGGYFFVENGEVNNSDPFNFYYPQHQINGKTIKDCYRIFNNKATKFGEVVYTFKEGIAAYRDDKNESWVFDRFE